MKTNPESQRKKLSTNVTSYGMVCRTGWNVWVIRALSFTNRCKRGFRCSANDTVSINNPFQMYQRNVSPSSSRIQGPSSWIYTIEIWRLNFPSKHPAPRNHRHSVTSQKKVIQCVGRLHLKQKSSSCRKVGRHCDRCYSGTKGNENRTVLAGGRAKLPHFGLETSAVVSIGVVTFRIWLAG